MSSVYLCWLVFSEALWVSLLVVRIIRGAGMAMVGMSIFAQTPS